MTKPMPDLPHSNTNIMISTLNRSIRHRIVEVSGEQYLFYDCRDMTMSLL